MKLHGIFLPISSHIIYKTKHHLHCTLVYVHPASMSHVFSWLLYQRSQASLTLQDLTLLLSHMYRSVLVG